MNYFSDSAFISVDDYQAYLPNERIPTCISDKRADTKTNKLQKFWPFKALPQASRLQPM